MGAGIAVAAALTIDALMRRAREKEAQLATLYSQIESLHQARYEDLRRIAEITSEVLTKVDLTVRNLLPSFRELDSSVAEKLQEGLSSIHEAVDGGLKDVTNVVKTVERSTQKILTQLNEQHARKTIDKADTQ